MFYADGSEGIRPSPPLSVTGRGRSTRRSVAVMVLTFAIACGCSSFHKVRAVPPAKGDYSAFLRKSPDLRTLQTELYAVRGVTGEFETGQVLVVALDRKATQDERDLVLTLLKSSTSVDHVETGGCDASMGPARVAECVAWSPTPQTP